MQKPDGMLVLGNGRKRTDRLYAAAVKVLLSCASPPKGGSIYLRAARYWRQPPGVRLDLALALHYDPFATLEAQMGSLGVPELIIIFVVALIVFGPKKLPELGKSLGKGLAEFRRASNELKSTIEEEVRAIEAEPPTRHSSASEYESESKSEPDPESKLDSKTHSETNLDAH